MATRAVLAKFAEKLTGVWQVRCHFFLLVGALQVEFNLVFVHTLCHFIYKEIYIMCIK